MATQHFFNVNINIATNAASGEGFVLHTDQEIAERNAVLYADLEQAIASWPMETDEAKAAEQQQKATDLRTAVRTEIEAHTLRQKADRDAALPLAETYDFTVRRPTGGEHMAGLAAANIARSDGEGMRFSEDAYVKHLLPLCVEGLTEKDILSLPMIVVQELRFRLLRAINPDPRRMRFAGPSTEAA